MTRPEDSSSNETHLQRIIADYRQALRDGRAPSIDEVVAQNPEWADQLRAELAAAQNAAAVPDSKTGSSVPSDQTMDWTPSETGLTNTDDVNTDVPTRVYASGSTPSPGTGAMEETACIEVGTTIGEYRLLRELGRGGMGVVYEAEHVNSGRRLALKLLAPDLPRTPETIKRFLNEASLAATLSHPRTTFIYEAGETEGHFFISMELMPGLTLKDAVETRGRLPVSQSVDYILDVLQGLEAAHNADVVHRDVKPSNCFMDDHGRVKVGDFGLSKSLVASSDLTQTGSFLGTPQFAAPEQVRGGNVDNRTDLFAVGATLYYLLAGQAPFTGDAAAVIAQIVADDPPPLEGLNPDIPKSLSRIVTRSLHKDPQRRFHDAGEFRRAIMPYSSQGTSIADVGRRVAAFFVDSIVVSFITATLIAFFAAARLGAQTATSIAAVSTIIGALTWIPYFMISEGMFGCSLGKFWLGLRVADMYGERPALWRALIRALILPGITWLTIDILQYRYNAAHFFMVEPQTVPDLNVWNSVIVPQSFTLARVGLCLLICSSMRKGNSFRGFHELASGTRVVRPFADESANFTLAVPRVAPVADDGLPATIGPFDVLGRLGRLGSMEVLSAYDQRLDRPAWVCLDGGDLSPERLRLVRPTRLHWLQEGTVGGRIWHAFEAFGGAPLTEVARYANLNWAVGRHVLLQTTEEIQASLADGTFPHHVGMGHVWVNERDQVKLLDFPLHASANSPTNRTSVEAEPAREDDGGRSALSDDQNHAARLWQDVTDICTTDEETPGRALDLAKQLKSTLPTSDAMQGIVDQLRYLVMQPYRFRWDDRLGVLAVSVGLETILYGSTALLVGMMLESQHQWPMIFRALLAGASGLILPAVVSSWMRGGIAFWLTKTEVRSLSRAPASRFRCAWRNVVAWSTVVLSQGLLGLWVMSASQLADRQGNTLAGQPPEFILAWAELGMYTGIIVIVQIVGAAFAILQPRRGLQDLLAGTYLVRR